MKDDLIVTIINMAVRFTPEVYRSAGVVRVSVIHRLQPSCAHIYSRSLFC